MLLINYVFFVFVILKLEHLNNLSKKNHVIIQQLERGQRVTRPIKIKYLANSERIMTATRQLTLGTITVKEFLLQCSHSTETYLRQEINWHNNIEQDENMQASDHQEDENMQANDLRDDENMQANVHQDDENQQENDNNERDVIVYDQIEPLQHVVNVIENNSYSDDGVYFPFLRPRIRSIERNDSDESVVNDGINRPLNNENESPSHQEIHWNEEDFIIPEELDPDIIYMMEIEENRRILEIQNLPYVQVQVPEVLPPVETGNQANMCVACLDAESTHALSPCGHKSLCLMCLKSLVTERCPICNSIFTSYLRIW
ncbi:RING finger protein B-like isoform X1 [Acyrthosiphon pisum]|uniref:RING-type domain-containing protein n=2 Tax=Acyrthosiphon pisum TaxID=7029 RepID=A0A8R2NWR9_ACYPI|nr:RING finger protein B-like isoform X1 [Acyrthosiphon pisum]